MAASYNGWTASKNPADFGGLDNRDIPGAPGVKYAPGIRRGAVATIAFWWGWQWHTRIERLTTPGNWGYFYKNSANSARLLSAHSGGTAWDTMAPRHPNGRRGTLNGPALQPGRTQLQVLREMLAYCEGVVYSGVDAWGDGTPDEMHAEMATGSTQADADRVAAKILRDFGPMESWAARSPYLGAPAAPAPAAPAPTAFDVRAWRVSYGQSDPRLPALRRWANRMFPAYRSTPMDAGPTTNFGPALAAFLAEFGARVGVPNDGRDLGPRLAAALHAQGFRG